MLGVHGQRGSRSDFFAREGRTWSWAEVAANMHYYGKPFRDPLFKPADPVIPYAEVAEGHE